MKRFAKFSSFMENCYHDPFSHTVSPRAVAGAMPLWSSAFVPHPWGSLHISPSSPTSLPCARLAAPGALGCSSSLCQALPCQSGSPAARLVALSALLWKQEHLKRKLISEPSRNSRFLHSWQRGKKNKIKKKKNQQESRDDGDVSRGGGCSALATCVSVQRG